MGRTARALYGMGVDVFLSIFKLVFASRRKAEVASWAKDRQFDVKVSKTDPRSFGNSKGSVCKIDRNCRYESELYNET